MQLLAKGFQREGDRGVLLEELNNYAFQIVLSQPSAAGSFLSHGLSVSFLQR
jgi:hypothetical protein